MAVYFKTAKFHEVNSFCTPTLTKNKTEMNWKFSVKMPMWSRRGLRGQRSWMMKKCVDQTSRITH